MRLKDEVALITGGSKGIGRATALLFAHEGAKVIVAARGASGLESVVGEIHVLGRDALGLPCDVGDASAVRKMVATAEKQLGKIDILVNNAGYFPSLHPVEQLPDAEWDRSLRDNLSSAFFVSRAVMPGMMRRRHGSVIMMSSLGAKAAYPYGAPYAAAKAGLFGLALALAAEGGPCGVRVNVISPGVVAGTEVYDKVGSELQRIVGLSPEDRMKGAAESALLRRVLSPEDVARAALFLASEDSASMTGQTLNVDAGFRFD